MEILNRYIDGRRKRDRHNGFAWYREFVKRNTVSWRIEISWSPRITS